MFDITQSHDKLTDVLASESSFDDGIASLIDFCAKQEPWRGWSTLRKLDWSTDRSRVKQWLSRLLTKEPPAKNIKAFWFGLFNPIIKGKATCGLYVAGAKEFDPDDDTFEWSCGPTYFPDGRYAQSQVLDVIYQKVKNAKGSVSSYGEYVLCLGYAGLVVKQIASTLSVETWLGTSASRAVAVGFDSGDGVLLGTITRRGWKPKTA